MEGEREPAEIARIKRELRAAATSFDEGGAWLAGAMEQSWSVAAQLMRYPELADLLGERTGSSPTTGRRLSFSG